MKPYIYVLFVRLLCIIILRFIHIVMCLTMVHSFLLLDSISLYQFSSVQLLSCVWLFATPWTAACQDSLSITISCNLLKLMSIESVMPSNHLILCHPLLLLPSIFPSIRVFSMSQFFAIRWPQYWSFSFSIIPSEEHPGLISLQSKGLSRASPTPQFKSIAAQYSSKYRGN